MKNFNVKNKKISERLNLVAVVTKNDSVVVAGAFDNEETAAQVVNLLDALKEREEKISPPFVSFNELCESWTQGKNAQLIKFKKHDDE